MERDLRPRKPRVFVLYRRAIHDRKKKYNTNPYIPHFLETFAAQCKPDAETLKRIKMGPNGRYIYNSSPRYQAFRRLIRMRVNRQVRTAERSSQGSLF